MLDFLTKLQVIVKKRKIKIKIKNKNKKKVYVISQIITQQEKKSWDMLS
jgi:hypothetical protein